ncbi:MAG: recombinase RecT [Chromatiaceae bacterium]
MANQPDARTALATRAEAQVATQPPTTAQRIMALESQFQVAMPKGMEAKRLIRDALTCLRTVRDLDRCDGDSVLGALMTCAQLGLRPGVLGHAWPLPFWDGRTQGMRAQLVIGYQGYIELGHRSGQILDIVARVAYEHDVFDVDYGLDEKLVHKPTLRGPRGEPIAYYAIVRYVSGGRTFLVMTQDEMIAHRDRYAPRNKQKQLVGPWVDNFKGQGLKTVLRQLAKFMPKSTDPMAEALAADGGVRVDLSPTAPPSDVTGLPPMWDGDVVDQSTAPAPLTSPSDPAGPAREPDSSVPPEPNVAAPGQDPGLASDAQIKAVQTLRNKLDGFKGNSAEARALFLVYVASVVGREVKSTKELTIAEASELIDDLQRAIKADKDREKATPSVAEVGAQQSATLRSMRGDGTAATEEEAGF